MVCSVGKRGISVSNNIDNTIIPNFGIPSLRVKDDYIISLFGREEISLTIQRPA